MSEWEVQRVGQRLVKWVNLGDLEKQCGIIVQQMDISIACQYSGDQVVHPARSERCDISCCIERSVLEETLTCCCGKEIDEQNHLVQDQELEAIVQFIRINHGKKFKMVRLDLINKQFRPF